jgi:arabinose-5-phosphate isomerase
MDILQEIKTVIKTEADELYALFNKVDGNVVRAVNLLHSCKGRVIIIGMGKAGLVGRKIASTFSSTGTSAIFIHPAEAFHGELGIIGKLDIAVFISNSGETEEVLRLAPHFKRLKITIIALTGNTDSTLAHLSDVVINVGVTREGCPIGCAPMASTTAALAMGDALAASLMIKRGFSRKHFAKFHPGGVLGKKLLLQVNELMVSGEEIPLVTPETTLNDAIYEITSKTLGAAFVVNGQGRLVGIFTDGDLRRLMMSNRNGGFWDKSIREIMIKNPVNIHKDKLAAEALKLMEDNSITVLPVLDNHKKVIGALHMHFLIRAGLT